MNPESILVTGSNTGFLNIHLAVEIQEAFPSAHLKFTGSPRTNGFDLCAAANLDMGCFFKGGIVPDIVIHSAAVVGGIQFNLDHPLELLRGNLKMGIHVLQAAANYKVPRVIMVGSVCAYPGFWPLGLPQTPGGAARAIREQDLWAGAPEPSNGPYGVAKRTLIELANQYHKAGPMQCLNLILANLYGPNDNFDLESSHAVPAIVRKIVDANRNGDREVNLWGTGCPTRDLLFVRDAARAIVMACQLPKEAVTMNTMNIATGVETPISDVANRVASLCDDWRGVFKWDRAKPGGQNRRKYDTTIARQLLNWLPETDLHSGLQETIRFYESMGA